MVRTSSYAKIFPLLSIPDAVKASLVGLLAGKASYSPPEPLVLRRVVEVAQGRSHAGAGVEIETEGERWVYDLPQEAVELLGSPVNGKQTKKAREIPRSGWEDGTGLEKRGGWRRTCER